MIRFSSSRWKGVLHVLADQAECQRWPRRWLIALAALVVLGSGVFSFQDDPNGKRKEQDEKGEVQAPPENGDPRKQETVTMNFREPINKLAGLHLFGPGMERMTQTDAKGLRLTMREGRADADTVGLKLLHRLSGDFAITLDYEILAIGAPLSIHGAGVALWLGFDAPLSLAAIFARMRRPYGEVFAAHRVLTGPDQKNQFLDNKEEKATQSRGRLRLVRSGSLIHFFTSEGAEFQKMHSTQFGSADVHEVQVFFTTNRAPITLDVRLTELEIKADRIDKDDRGPMTADSDPPPNSSPENASGLWLVAVAILAVVTFLVALGVWLILRRQRETATRRVSGEPGSALT